MALNPVDMAVHHVRDASMIELPHGIEIPLPNICGFQVTKYMALELLAAALMILLFVPLSRKIASGRPPKGRLWNMLDMVVLFVRDEMVRPSIGHGADRFLPFVLTVFFFILFCNLLGLLPWLGSPTGSINVTAVLALYAFLVVVGAGMKKFGVIQFWLGLCPHMDLPKPLAVVLVPMILVIEIMSLCIKHTILAIRLLANMFAGHLVLGVIVGFIPLFAGSFMWYGVTPVAVLGATALSCLELLVAFLQAYIFAFLTALFIGMCVHQH